MEPIASTSSALPELQGAQGPPDLLSLEVTAGPCQGACFAKASASLSVGRTRASEICIKDPAVSEQHALFAWQDGCWTLQDKGSSNGTTLNGTRLEAEGDAVQLKDGDVILFGTESKVSVEISPVPSESLTVEQYLQVECQRQVQRAKARSEQLANQLREEWETGKVQIQEAAA